MASAAISFSSAGSPCWVSLCCRLARGTGRDDRKMRRAYDRLWTNGRKERWHRRPIQPTQHGHTAARRQGEFIHSLFSPKSFISSPFLHLQPSSASQAGLTLLAESEPVAPASPTRTRPHLHQG